MNHNFYFTKNEAESNWVFYLKQNIESFILANGLQLRMANISDINKISNFQSEIFYPHTATLESRYELFRIIKFGYALLIENCDNELAGFYTTIHYGTSEKAGYGIKSRYISRNWRI